LLLAAEGGDKGKHPKKGGIMNFNQVLEITEQHDVEVESCDRCGRTSDMTFGFGGIENLCLYCFVSANIDQNIMPDTYTEFATALSLCTTSKDLIALCREWEA
jgi:hypothetical protein